MWQVLAIPGCIYGYLWLSPSSIRVQLQAGDIALLLFETFSFFYFFTRAISRGARAPKNKGQIAPLQGRKG